MNAGGQALKNSKAEFDNIQSMPWQAEWKHGEVQHRSKYTNNRGDLLTHLAMPSSTVQVAKVRPQAMQSIGNSMY